MIDKSDKNLACCDEATYNYALEHSTPESDILSSLDKVTNQQTIYPRMMIGHLQGQFFQLLTKLIKPKNILEIGTFTGYSTIAFAQGLDDKGKIYTIDINPEWSYISSEYFKKSGYNDKIISIIGEASKIIPILNINFDLVFIDADKNNLFTYYDMIIEKINSGSTVLIDNVLWNGQVVGNRKPNKDSIMIDNFNKYVTEDMRTENVLLPIRDGIMMVVKK